MNNLWEELADLEEEVSLLLGRKDTFQKSGDINLKLKIDNLIQKQEKIYFQPEKGERAPEGSKIGRGPKGGDYYTEKKEILSPEIKPEKTERMKEFEAFQMKSRKINPTGTKNIEEVVGKSKSNLVDNILADSKSYRYLRTEEIKNARIKVKEVIDFVDFYIRLADNPKNITNSEIDKFSMEIVEKVSNYLGSHKVSADISRKIEDDFRRMCGALQYGDRSGKIIAIDRFFYISHSIEPTIIPQVYGLHKAGLSIPVQRYLISIFDYLASKEEKMEKSFIEVRKQNRIKSAGDIIKSIDNILKTGQQIIINKQDLDHFESQASSIVKESFDEIIKQEKVHIEERSGGYQAFVRSDQGTLIPVGNLEVAAEKARSNAAKFINENFKEYWRKRGYTISKQEKVYFQPEKGEKAPEGSNVREGPKGGKYYKKDKLKFDDNVSKLVSSFTPKNNYGYQKVKEIIKKTGINKSDLQEAFNYFFTNEGKEKYDLYTELPFDPGPVLITPSGKRVGMFRIIPKKAFQKTNDIELKLENIKRAVNDIIAKSDSKNAVDLVSKADVFINKYSEDLVVDRFLGGYKQLAMLGPDLPQEKLQKLFSLAHQVNIIKSLDQELKSEDRLDAVISIDTVAHQLHILSRKNSPPLYPILDDLADISKELGETNRNDRLLLLNTSSQDVVEKFNELEIFQKGNLFEQGKSYWKLLEKCIKHSVESLTSAELVILREWIFSRI